MDQLHWPLTVLNRSIAFKNLTAASQNVGISQPQLSRLIKQLEDELNVTLLDRSSPRHTTWTPEARKLAELFNKSEKTLAHALEEFCEGSHQKEIKIGFLEGLSPIAKEYAKILFDKTSVETIHLDVFDQNDLEARFLVADIDLVFTSRVPNNKKHLYFKELGYQFIEKKSDKLNDIMIYSGFEFNTLPPIQRKKQKKKVISNSLFVRKSFQELFGGTIRVPSAVRSGIPPTGSTPVIAIAQEYVSQNLWDCLKFVKVGNI